MFFKIQESNGWNTPLTPASNSILETNFWKSIFFIKPFSWDLDKADDPILWQYESFMT